MFAYVVGGVRETANLPKNLRTVARKSETPRAFDETGLALAGWIADAYVCSLGEALGAVVLAGALPRAVDRFVPLQRPAIERVGAVPERLVRFIWDDFAEGFGLEAFLRLPESRRIGDRKTLLGYLGTLVQAGFLERTRTFAGARVSDATVRVLTPASAPIAGKKAAALAAFVRERGEVRRSEAVLAGYSDSVIRRAIAAGALAETQRIIVAERTGRSRLPPFAPTAEQRTAIERVVELLAAQTFGQLLLHGITGSGKTYVYLAAIAQVIAAGGRAIVLVPEISLTPQTARRFEDAFGDRVAVLHSALSDRERYDAWQAAARGEIAVVVGARSAVFAPLAGVRLIVIDEEHETSYKQDSVPRYSAVDVARERMRQAGGVVVLGSATPALDDYAKARAGRFSLVRLRERATAQPLPETHIVNMSAEFDAGNRRMFSTPLLQAIERRIERGEKTVLFVNRRGTARFILCRTCGHVPECVRCSTSLVVHRGEGVLRCHYCDAQQPIPENCPNCGTGPIREFGVGTQRVASEIEALYPRATVIRMDSDTTTRVGEHARLLDRFMREGDVLVGTQMVAKGLDFPQVTLVGAIAADLDLHVADFRASERTFALITQVCGRSGRASAGEAFIQTYSPEHPAIRFAAAHDYDGFAEIELLERRELQWPPYVRLAYVGAIGRDRAVVEETIARYADLLRDDERWQILGPAAYPLARLNNEWRYRIAIKTRDMDALRAALREKIVGAARSEKTTRITITIDP
ncbi:MAG: hypothetical protein NVSMB64_13370 [Candidatus Velthaea sp.]